MAESSGPGRVEVIFFARRTRQIIGWISALLAVGFTWLQIKNINIASIVTGNTPDAIWRGSLIVYYLSWTAGTLFDTDIQEVHYVTVPNKGEWSLHTYVVVLILAVVAAALCLTEGNIEWFAIVLSVFIFVDHISWRYLIWYMKPAVDKSEEAYRSKGDWFAIEKLNVVVNQIEGNWKWWRLCVGIPIVLILDAFAFNGTVNTLLTSVSRSVIPNISYDDASFLCASILVMAFVVAVETWHWVIRINTIVSIRLLENLGAKFELIPQEKPSAQRARRAGRRNSKRTH
jgi:hypothetical protein